jgi:hypothetical protein
MIVKPMAGPRHLVVAARSFAGSRSALLDAAAALVTASGAIKLGRDTSQYEDYTDAAGREFLGNARLMTSELPVEQILGLVSGVEERLRDPQGDPARPAVELHVLWVEGVEADRPDLTLPSPLIFGERWANRLFAAAGQDAFMGAVARGTESQATADRIEERQKHFIKVGPNPRFMIPPGGFGELLGREKGGVRWRSWATDEADLLAQAGALALMAYQERRRIAAEPGPFDEELAVRAARSALAEIASDNVQPITGAAPAGAPLERRAALWLGRIADQAVRKDLSIGRVVVWQVGATEIRGALLTGPPHALATPGPIEEVRIGAPEGNHREVSFLAR